MSIRSLKWIISGPVLALSLLGHVYGAESPAPQSGQPAQISSKVNYDPHLSDPFFESEKWTYTQWVEENVNGRIVRTRKECASGQKTLKCLKNTARCISSQMFDHTIDFCHAKLLDGGTIELSIKDDHSPIVECLSIVVENGEFWSRYGISYKVG